ncbi:MAG: hypothetical protein ACK5NT_10920, partial [Pyrinomonadaceae bacterium]
MIRYMKVVSQKAIASLLFAGIFACSQYSDVKNRNIIEEKQPTKLNGEPELICSNVFEAKPEFYHDLRLRYFDSNWIFVVSQRNVKRISKIDCSEKTVVELIFNNPETETNVLDPVNRAAAIARSTTSYIQDFSCNISGVCLTIVSDTGAEFLISNDWGDNWKKEKIKLKTVEAIHVNNVEFFRFRNGEAIW